MYRIGIDLGGTNIAVGVVDDRHNIIAEASVPTGAFRPAEEMVADMCRAVELALDKAGLIAADCASIGIGSPGTCDSEAGVVMRAYNLGWFNVPVCRMLHERFGIPVRLSNDANCAAIGRADNLRASALGGAFCSPPPRSCSLSSVRSWITSAANSLKRLSVTSNIQYHVLSIL